MHSHTFVIEIDRQSSKEQERLRWRWPQPQTGSSNTSGNRASAVVAEELMLFLDQKVGGGPGTRGIGDPTAAVGKNKRTGYIVEMHDRNRCDWIPLSTSAFTDGSIPKNCRLRVSVPARVELPHAAGKTTPTPPSAFAESDERRPKAAADDVPLALPWRRFDRELRSEGGGLEVRGRKLVVQDVPNSGEGTGLFTWDGSVLLAKYVEHRAAEIVVEHPSSRSERDGEGSDSLQRAFCVLELGCGTGLAGLAAASALGQQLREEGVSITPPELDTRLAARRNRGVAGGGSLVEAVLTDLPYALENTRANVARNAEPLDAAGVGLVVRELDWLRPVPQELLERREFDLILAADVVWLDELVGPLVRTLERLTAGWASDERASGTSRPPSTSPPPGSAPTASSIGAGAKPSSANRFAGEFLNGPDNCPETALVDVAQVSGPQVSRSGNREGMVQGAAKKGVGRSDRRRRPKRRLLLAYQWRSERTGRALLRELDRAFHVREIPKEVKNDKKHPLPHTRTSTAEALSLRWSATRTTCHRIVCACSRAYDAMHRVGEQGFSLQQRAVD